MSTHLFQNVKFKKSHIIEYEITNIKYSTFMYIATRKLLK